MTRSLVSKLLPCCVRERKHWPPQYWPTSYPSRHRYEAVSGNRCVAEQSKQQCPEPSCVSECAQPSSPHAHRRSHATVQCPSAACTWPDVAVVCLWWPNTFRQLVGVLEARVDHSRPRHRTWAVGRKAPKPAFFTLKFRVIRLLPGLGALP